MCRHQRRDPAPYRCRERLELDLLQAFERVRQTRQFEMRVLTGVAVSWELLAAGRDVHALEASRQGHAELAHSSGVRPNERAAMTGLSGLVSMSSTGA